MFVDGDRDLWVRNLELCRPAHACTFRSKWDTAHGRNRYVEKLLQFFSSGFITPISVVTFQNTFFLLNISLLKEIEMFRQWVASPFLNTVVCYERTRFLFLLSWQPSKNGHFQRLCYCIDCMVWSGRLSVKVKWKDTESSGISCLKCPHGETGENNGTSLSVVRIAEAWAWWRISLSF